MEDDKIIELFFKRDEKALSETQLRYGRLCQSIAVNILKNKEDAEECVNDSYIKLWNAIPPNKPHSLCGYLCMIVRNTACTAYEKARRRSYEQQYEELCEILPDNIGLEERFESRQLGKCINDFLSKQKRKNRELFVARYYFNMSISEIAESFGMNENTVKTRFMRIRAELKRFLKERGVEV